MKRWAACPFSSLPAILSAQLTEAERKGIEDALIGNLKLTDLNFARRPHEDKYRLGLVNQSIDKPLETTDRLFALHAGSIKLSGFDAL